MRLVQNLRELAANDVGIEKIVLQAADRILALETLACNGWSAGLRDALAHLEHEIDKLNAMGMINDANGCLIAKHSLETFIASKQRPAKHVDGHLG